MSYPKHELSVDYNNLISEIIFGRDKSSESDSVARRLNNEMKTFKVDARSCSAFVIANLLSVGLT
jgi:hypothetical protein